MNEKMKPQLRSSSKEARVAQDFKSMVTSINRNLHIEPVHEPKQCNSKQNNLLNSDSSSRVLQRKNIRCRKSIRK